jgi:hypothetical protein
MARALQAGGVRPSLVVVDSISAVLSPVVGGAQHNQGEPQTQRCQA